MKIKRISVIVIVATCFVNTGVFAEKTATISDNSAKFFLFHKNEVLEDVARGDILYCIKAAKPAVSYRRKFGGIGMLDKMSQGAIGDKDTFRMRNAIMRKCMTLHGYNRYAVAESYWNTMVKQGDIVVGNDGKVDAEVIDAMAAYASGPQPTTEALGK